MTKRAFLYGKKLDDILEIMIWKTYHTNSRICKKKRKEKAIITQLKTYKYEGILSNTEEEEQNIYKKKWGQIKRLEEVRRV